MYAAAVRLLLCAAQQFGDASVQRIKKLLGIGASKKDMAELGSYIVRILETYFPEYYKNKKAGLFSDADVPMPQKAATALLKFLVHTRLIYPVSRCLARDKK